MYVCAVCCGGGAGGSGQGTVTIFFLLLGGNPAVCMYPPSSSGGAPSQSEEKLHSLYIQPAKMSAEISSNCDGCSLTFPNYKEACFSFLFHAHEGTRSQVMETIQ